MCLNGSTVCYYVDRSMKDPSAWLAEHRAGKGGTVDKASPANSKWISCAATPVRLGFKTGGLDEDMETRR